MEKAFYSESRVCDISWSQIVSEHGLADKKIYLRRKYFFLHLKDILYIVFNCKLKIVQKKLTVLLIY